ncbi:MULTISPECIES: hypothetical protein [Streptacidiphilus]|uniref:PBP domain-containing protein n=1 Tax=Streptacidiphilus cavernicola TaxID=3342716 RepID=A0ABV6USH9_9ACTN|nr:hypothetical protein [Streptacidiphilus jeojiense]
MTVRARRISSARRGFRRGAAVVLTALLLLGGLGTLPQSAHTLTQAQAASAVTVDGPPVWQPNPGDPTTGSYGPKGSVTVSQTTELTDQVLHVSWTGFTPTTTGSGAGTSAWTPNVTPGSLTTFYPVRVYECRGANPKITDCYGSTLYNADPKLGFQQPEPASGTTTPEFPSNMRLMATRPDGTGSADIEVWTAEQSQSLGCDVSHACSIVVEPNYGGDSLSAAQLLGTPGGCTDHSADPLLGEGADGGLQIQDLVTGNWDGETCAWSERTVVPLSFAPTPSDCKAATASFTAQGLEISDRAMQLWRSGLCQGTAPMSLQYTFGGGEPQARAAFLAGTGADVALTAYPDTGAATRPYVYAPLATTAISVAFVVDNGGISGQSVPVQGQQITRMRLNARLLAKLLTQSYSDGAGNGSLPGFASVAGNPACIFQDPEFLQLNPVDPVNGPVWPSCDYSQYPIVTGGTTDLVRQLTTWIHADPDARAFLQGAPDPWGMHVDSYYLPKTFSGYPVDSLVPQDSTGTYQGANGTIHRKQEDWIPLLGGLTQVDRNVIQAQPSCIHDDTGSVALTSKCAPEAPGIRSVFAITDAATAQAFSLPTAQLQNPSGAFVGPDLHSMQAAVDDMPLDARTGTQVLPYGTPGTAFASDAAAYPLTQVSYAMVPTRGLSDAKAGSISRFLTQVTASDSGQVYGFDPGELAPGFLDLTSQQQEQAASAAEHVLAQDGTLPGNQGVAHEGGSTTGATSQGTSGGSTTSTSGGTGGGSGGAASGGTAGGTTSGGTGGTSAGSTGGASGGQSPNRAGSSATPLAVQNVAAGQADPDRAGAQRLLLPALLIAGAALLIGGPAVLLLGGTGAGAGLRQGWGRTAAAARRGVRRMGRRG